jgi:hypothetical protein
MASKEAVLPSNRSDLLKQILSTVQSIQKSYSCLPAAVETLQGQVNILAGIERIQDAAEQQNVPISNAASTSDPIAVDHSGSQNAQSAMDGSGSMPTPDAETHHGTASQVESSPSARKPSTTTISRIILTTYPGQSGIDPLIMNWGHPDALLRGPVVVSRNQSTIRRRNGRL